MEPRPEGPEGIDASIGGVSAALKEWAAVAGALREGRQTILLRAGGIADPSGRFGFVHPRFWIYPTRFHEAAGRLVESARGLVAEAEREAGEAAAAGSEPVVRRLDLVAELDMARWIDDFPTLERLAAFHVLAPQVVRERFDYRDRGVAVAIVRVWRRREPHRIVETSAMAGCRSWVDLDGPLACDGVEPVLSDEAFGQVRRRIADVLGS